MSVDERKLEPVFCADDDWKANACLNWWHQPIDLYAHGYKEGGDRLAKFVIETESDQDYLIYPIAFLYRQYIELRLKEIIKEGLILVEEGNDFPKHHKIWALWCLAKKLMIKVSIKIFDEKPLDLNHAEHVIKEFAQVDPESLSFRYPATKQGNKNLDGIPHINIRRLAEHMEGLSKDLESVSIAISVYRDWQEEMWSQNY